MEGRVSDQYLCETLQTMDMGVGCDPINSYNDHCTMNKTLEYMAFGKPQVLFGINEGRVSAGDAAVYVDENCPIQLGDAIVNLLDNPELCRRLGKIGRERVEGDLSWSRSVDQLKLAYQRALDD
jgi:glycosyltransferase involved in cell wall biosynthesis